MLLAGSISHTSTHYMDFVEILTFHWIYLLFIFLILVGVELYLCIVVTLSCNAITCFWSQIEYESHCFISKLSV